ncbi:MAG: hypothetical protein K0U54_08685 [Bacteroidetes bacterium]|nr:hypothetical protein [Bacteroidota bacterium]
MKLFALEGNMDGLGILILGIFFVGFGIPIILAIIGLILRSKGKKNSAKVLFIIAGIYLLVSLGICGSMMM